VGDKASYLDYGYFGVLGATFDENGVATGEYTPKPSYRSLQVIAAIFRDEFSHSPLPIEFIKLPSNRIHGDEDLGKEILHAGFRKPNGASAFVYWKPTNLMTTSFESTISLEAAHVAGEARLIDLIDGSVYALPEGMVTDNGKGHRLFKHLPLKDSPLVLTFGEFAEIG
jgi:hypothetical protein